MDLKKYLPFTPVIFWTLPLLASLTIGNPKQIDDSQIRNFKDRRVISSAVKLENSFSYFPYSLVRVDNNKDGTIDEKYQIVWGRMFFGKMNLKVTEEDQKFYKNLLSKL